MPKRRPKWVTVTHGRSGEFLVGYGSDGNGYIAVLRLQSPTGKWTRRMASAALDSLEREGFRRRGVRFKHIVGGF